MWSYFGKYHSTKSRTASKVVHEISFLFLIYLLVSIWTKSCCFIIFLTVNVCGVVKGLIATSDWSSSLLVLKVPVEAGEWSVLLTFVL